MSETVDVIVVGGGGSGLAAAVSSAEAGLRVLLVEKLPQPGGTTGIAVGSFTANRTAWQQRAGVDDTLDEHVEDMGRFPPEPYEAQNNAGLRRYFASEANTTLDWLAAMGIAFHGPSPEPPNRVPRMHNVVPNAKAYIATLHARLIRLGGEVLCSATVEALTREDDRVTGVEVRVNGGERRTIRARRGVVLAAGDYANSPELIGKYRGEAFTTIEGINPHATGDGHRLAESAGAPLVNMDVAYGPELRFVPPSEKGFVQLLPSSGPLLWIMGRLLPFVPTFVIHKIIKRLLVTWQHPENALFDDGAILVNREGRRFCNERIWPDREIALSQQPGKIAYILLDTRLIKKYSAWPHFISTAPEIAYAYVEDYLRLRPDVAVRADSLERLAVARHLPLAAIRATVDEVNRSIAGGQPDGFGRVLEGPPLEGNRWVLLGPAKAYFTTTEGSPPINARMEVLDAAGAPIPGLYAVGQNGLGGQVLWGHGLHIAWAMTSGRLVGRILAESEPAGA